MLYAVGKFMHAICCGQVHACYMQSLLHSLTWNEGCERKFTLQLTLIQKQEFKFPTQGTPVALQGLSQGYDLDQVQSARGWGQSRY